MNNNIINIVNFIRAVEPRPGRSIDLFGTVREQMALAKQHRLPVTWLLQYDALEAGYPEFLISEMPDNHEVGIWFETVEDNVKAAGIEWRGRWSWDWHTNVGFSVGYTPKEREKIADVFIALFERKFGCPPRSTGSWLFDAHLLNYLYERHGIEAACNCKDQYGTDGYTLHGGYWSNAYYPSKLNSYMPAQTREQQIPVPVFRMLGSDPLHQYSAPQFNNGQTVITLEPISAGGNDPKWVDWFLAQNRNEPHLALSYMQAGQENSFGWPAMADGLRDQFAKIARLRDAGVYRVETMLESGRWFHQNFKETPTSAVITRSDWQPGSRAAGIWYLNKYGRINLYADANGVLTIRDWHLFCEQYEEPFLHTNCPDSACTYDTLPVVDQLCHPGECWQFPGGPGQFADISSSGDSLTALWRSDSGHDCQIELDGQTLTVRFDRAGDTIQIRCADRPRRTDQTLHFTHRNFKYVLTVNEGSIIALTAGEFALAPVDGKLTVTAKVTA